MLSKGRGARRRPVTLGVAERGRSTGVKDARQGAETEGRGHDRNLGKGYRAGSPGRFLGGTTAVAAGRGRGAGTDQRDPHWTGQFSLPGHAGIDDPAAHAAAQVAHGVSDRDEWLA